MGTYSSDVWRQSYFISHKWSCETAYRDGCRLCPSFCGRASDQMGSVSVLPYLRVQCPKALLDRNHNIQPCASRHLRCPADMDPPSSIPTDMSTLLEPSSSHSHFLRKLGGLRTHMYRTLEIAQVGYKCYFEKLVCVTQRSYWARTCLSSAHLNSSHQPLVSPTSHAQSSY